MPDYNNVIEALKIVDPTKPYGTELFDALARVTISIGIEAVCLRLNSNREIEVYLTQRSQDDTAYPGEWHCPGSIMRPGEEVEDVFVRLVRKEFAANLLSTRFVANINHTAEARGHCLSIVYLCVLKEKEGPRGKWFLADELPEKTVEHHRKRVIPCALGAFVADCTDICS